MKQFYIQLTRPNKGFKALSWLIRKILRTDYSHVIVRWFGAKDKVEIVWEAAGSSIRFLGPIAHDKKYVVIKEYAVDITPTEYSKLIEYTHKYAHVDYGKLQLIGMLIARIFKMKKNILSKGEAEQVCSEAVAGLLKFVKGWDIDINMDVYGPDALDKWLEKKTKEKSA